jgi:hypothetical protein
VLALAAAGCRQIQIDDISVEDCRCHCHNDLSLFEKFKKSTAIVGFVDVAMLRSQL